MNIAVCVKQVPAADALACDPVTGVLIRSGAPARINPYDLRACEAALQLGERLSGTTTALTMGPESAKDALKEAVAMGVGEGVLVSDKAFAGADVYITARTMANALKHLGGFDIIVCGSHTTDGDTGQTGPELAQLLGLPLLYNVTALLETGADITMAQKIDGEMYTVSIAPPFVLVAEKEAFNPRLPGLKQKLAAGKKVFQTLGLSELGDTAEDYGLSASPTRVKKISVSGKRAGGNPITGTPEELASVILKAVASPHQGGAAHE